MSKTDTGRRVRTDPKGDVRSTTATPLGSALHPEKDHTSPYATTPTVAIGCLAHLLDRGDGWVRATSDTDGKTVYLKYKWKSGKWRNHYVMVVCVVDQLSWGLALLETKVSRVSGGEMRPTHDSAYNYDE